MQTIAENNSKKVEAINNVIAAYNHTVEQAIDHFDVRHFGIRRVKAEKEGRLSQEIKEQESKQAVFVSEKDAWCLQYFKDNFPRFEKSNLYKVVIGEIEPSSMSCLIPFKKFLGK